MQQSQTGLYTHYSLDIEILNQKLPLLLGLAPGLEWWKGHETLAKAIRHLVPGKSTQLFGLYLDTGEVITSAVVKLLHVSVRFITV